MGIETAKSANASVVASGMPVNDNQRRSMDMSKEVSTKVKEPAPLITTTDRSVAAIIPRDIEQVYRFATAVIRGKMAPKSYNDNPDSVTVGILHGLEIGLTPMAALQSIAVINGMPTIWGDGALALVRASNLLEDISETMEGEGDSRVAVCVLRRIGQKSEIRRTFSFSDAKLAGLVDKQGPWKQYPQRMMQMRARAWALRDGFADVLRGLAVAEERQDMTPLVQAADGSYVPVDRPLRQHYLDQADQRKAAAIQAEQEATGETEAQDAKATAPDKEEAGPVLYQFVTWEGEIEEDLHSGTFCDHIEAAFKDARDIPALEAAWENNADAIAALLTDPDGQQTKAWHKSLQDAFAARIVALTPAEETEPLVNAKGAVALFGADGLVVNRYQRVMPWFDNLKQHVAKAKDRSAVIDANAAGAEHWVAQKAANAAAFWAEIQKMGATEKV
jgi:hypothetical protein